MAEGAGKGRNFRESAGIRNLLDAEMMNRQHLGCLEHSLLDDVAVKRTVHLLPETAPEVVIRDGKRFGYFPEIERLKGIELDVFRNPFQTFFIEFLFVNGHLNLKKMPDDLFQRKHDPSVIKTFILIIFYHRTEQSEKRFHGRKFYKTFRKTAFERLYQFPGTASSAVDPVLFIWAEFILVPGKLIFQSRPFPEEKRTFHRIHHLVPPQKQIPCA